ncbi:MAG: acetyl-CoA carboxylase biotin carboxyl carrier protein [Candidatus Puniceispirillaceae bacterium]
MATASKKPAAKKATLDDEVKLVKNLTDILDKAGLAELEYKTETLTVRLSRHIGTAPVPAAQPVVATAAASVPVRVSGSESEAPENPADHPGAIKSPMVGTVYTAPEPDAPAFVTEGDSITQGQTILIVEAMKVMNPITAPKTGTVVKILVQNAQPVEFGEALVIIE